VLPDREAATLTAWLRAHPGTGVICRDRAAAYADGAAAGAPAAIQVADRWHLWHNLCEHAVHAVARHRDCLKEPVPGTGQDPEPAPQAPGDLEAVIRERHAAVHELRGSGKNQAQTAAALGLGRGITGRFWRAATAEDLLAAIRPAPGLDPWKPYLRQRWEQGATTIKVLHDEITARGYGGSSATTYGYASLFRLAIAPRPAIPPRPGQVTRQILSDPAGLDPDGASGLAAVRARCPELDALARHVTGFAKILTGRRGHQPGAWITAVDADPGQPDLHSFTTGIRQDYQAVRNGLTLPWNSGRVEGHNTRVKLLKRQMYGRASFPLLRKRILLTS
jgi:hypothetical protein